MYDHDTKVVRKGCILISDANRHGQILDIILETENMQQYRIAPNEIGQDLIDHVYKDVIISGKMNPVDIDAIPIIVVESFRIVPKSSQTCKNKS